MNLLRKNIFSICIILSGILFNYLIVEGNTSVFRQVYTLLFIFLVPGMVLLSIIRLHPKYVMEKLLLIVGLSISFLLLAGLAENFLLFAFFVKKPLETFPLLYFFDIVLGILLITNICVPKKVLISALPSGFSASDRIIVGISSLLPFLAVVGAVVLNNGGSNILTILMLILIPLLLLSLIIFENTLNESTNYWYLFMASVSLLLMLSLRSWHISGWDINDEFRIFQLTKQSGYWDPLFGHAYNACLTLTILPTIISRLTSMNDEYIYKLVFQLVFALTPIALYSVYRNFSTKIASLLAVFYIIAQPFFIQPMTALNRQEIALFFFSLTLYAAFTRPLRKSIANLLFILFGISMVVSHYSTTYVSISLFVSSFCIIAFLRIVTKHTLIKKLYKSIKSLRFNVSLNRNIQAIPLLILVAFTYFWFFQFTQTSGNVTSVLLKTIENLKYTFKEKQQSDETTKSLTVFTAKSTNTNPNIARYVDLQTQRYINSAIPTYHLKQDTIPLYPVTNISVKPVAAPVITRLVTDGLNVIKLITKVIVFLGPLLLLLKYLPKSSDKEYIILNTVGVALVVLVIVHPTLGEAYNLSRIYLHILFIASLGGVVCLLTLFPKVTDKVKYITVGLIFSCMFVLFSGLSSQFIGGIAFMHLNNYGDDYDKFYTHEQEVQSARWLANHTEKNVFIYADDVSNLRLLSFANIAYAFPVLLPSAMYRNSYVYARYANVIRLRTDGDLSGIHLEYTFPVKFLNDNKNLVYNNGGSRIYR